VENAVCQKSVKRLLKNWQTAFPTKRSKKLLTTARSYDTIQSQAEGRHTRVVEGESGRLLLRLQNSNKKLQKKDKKFLKKSVDNLPDLCYNDIRNKGRAASERQGQSLGRAGSRPPKRILKKLKKTLDKPGNLWYNQVTK